MPSVFVVIVNYRAADLTAEAVASLGRCRKASSLRFVIVDNGSEESELRSLRESCPGCDIIPAGRNLGFGGGCNMGIRHALEQGADFILLFNNDAEAEADFLSPLVKAAEDGGTVATPKILDANGRIWYGGGSVDFRRGGFYHETDSVRAEIGREVSFASGCCLLIPRKVFETAGLFSEDYFLYYEDADYCMRLRVAGVRIRYVPESVIRHKVSATVGENSKLTAYYGTRNRLLLLSRFGFPKLAFAYVVATRILRILASFWRPAAWCVVPGIVDWLRGRSGWREGLPDSPACIVINGVFVGRRGSGLERFALETLRALDGMTTGGRLRLLVPRKADLSQLPEFSNIDVVRFGRLRGALWEQIDLARYARRHRAKVLSLTNTVPFWHADYACLHDVFYVTHAREFSASFTGWLSVVWHRMHYRAIARRAMAVFTVSKYSAGQISAVLGIPQSRISVLGNGWEHMRRIKSNEDVFHRFPGVEKGGYCFVLGNRCPYKNMTWVLSCAAALPETRWVVTGAPFRTVKAKSCELPNLIFTGYLSDGEMKALMEHCRVLVCPSLDEGFGIPPLEALSVGRPALVARNASMPEVYGDAVSWIDNPARYDGVLDPSAVKPAERGAVERVLARNTWENVARKLFEGIS